MNKTFLKSLCAAFSTVAIFAIVGCGGSSSQNASVSPALTGIGSNVSIPDTSLDQGPGMAHTNHVILTGKSNQIHAFAFTGYSPAQMRTCYGISGNGAGTIVIVDAYDDKFALADFNQFSAQYGLPQETSTNVTSASNLHLQVVYAQGNKPRYNAGWSQEESLDIEWAHAMAPNAKIVLVEAANNSNANLYGADDVAATISGAHQCSNSWGGGESSGETGSDGHFNHSGVVYFFSGGDVGGSKSYPATSVNVVACGGTSVTLNGSNGRATETVWNGTGCGLSSYEARPSYQSVISGIVGTHRGADDIAAVADPNTGVSVRWNGGWYIFGGTSVACPMIAGMVNTAGTNRASANAENTQIYSKLGTSSLFDVTSGTAGSFSAAAGWDYPTGCGTPNGTSAF